MIDQTELKPILENYQTYLIENWDAEKYKWEAIKSFQIHWDHDADDFGAMFMQATDQAFCQLTRLENDSQRMIVNFANADVEATRSMFRVLYDETKDLVSRIIFFQKTAKELRDKYDDGTWHDHRQNINAISTYLWLRYPDRYCIYQYEEAIAISNKIKSEYRFENDDDAFNYQNYLLLNNEIAEELERDMVLVEIFHARITDNCYPDPKLCTLAMAVGSYICHHDPTNKDDILDGKWYPSDFDPGLSVADWISLLVDDSIFTTASLEIMKRMKDHGGQATCAQLASRYGETKTFYNRASFALAGRIADKTGCPIQPPHSKNSRYWPILYVGRYARKDEGGGYVWKLRPELDKALDQIDLSGISLYAGGSPVIWKISQDQLSPENRILFETRNIVVIDCKTVIGATSETDQDQSFVNDIKAGDLFYLCHGGSIRLLGQFVTDRPVLNRELHGSWYERKYHLIKKSNDLAPYRSIQKQWTPNTDATCIKIDAKDKTLFEEIILKPYFNMTIGELMQDHTHKQRYWWLTANPRIWSFTKIQVGEEQSYTLYNKNGNKRRVFQNFLDVKPGDLVLCYESTPVMKVVAIAQIIRENDGEAIAFKKIEGLSTPIEYSELRACPELKQMEFFLNPNGSLFALTKDEFDFIQDLIRESNPLQAPKKSLQRYSKKDFLNEVYMSAERYDILAALLRNKLNVILQGPPGVGKTFTAKKLAYSMMGEIDESRIEMVQFHQSYSYEDLIMGYRPDGSGFKLTDGIFYRFCKTAENHPDQEYFFIIDEINRGNLSKIFGELLMLIEKDYRGSSIALAYNGLPFSVPKNLYIIGMMNTADRSLALIDYALRRRFSFFELEPGFDSEGFTQYKAGFANKSFNALIDQIKVLNREIVEDRSLGRGFQIGHSYFCGRQELGCDTGWLRSVIEFDILPMLKEYWFDEPDQLARWEQNLRGVF